MHLYNYLMPRSLLNALLISHQDVLLIQGEFLHRDTDAKAQRQRHRILLSQL